MKKGIIIGLLLMEAILHITAQELSNVQQPEVLRNRDRREIRIPNVLGYHVMKCDFHIHTVFSDGSVWPTVRVEEAWSEGLDAISITEHLEYSPKSESVVWKYFLQLLSHSPYCTEQSDYPLHSL